MVVLAAKLDPPSKSYDETRWNCIHDIRRKLHLYLSELGPYIKLA